MPIILASSSPRRSELLAAAGVKFEILPSSAEEIHDVTMKPNVLCELNARLKADAVARERPNSIVIGADTLVFIDDLPLGKPADLNEARAMLRRLSGRTHQVCTGVCVIHPGGHMNLFHGLTHVVFRSLDEDCITDYFQRVNPLDKAGAYGIQEHGDLIISSISGCFDNVMGLPIDKVLAALT
jgi:septum formation protein